MTETEISMILELRQQSSRAQQQALELYGNNIFSQILRMISQFEDAEEVYQDVFIKVFQNIKQYDDTKSSFKTWISKIAYNESISFLRRKRLLTISFDDYDEKIEDISDLEVEETLGHPNKEIVQLIKAALKYLPPDEHAIISMFYYEEMSLKEIAYVTESLPTTIASKLCRTRKKLCKIINMLQS